MRVLVVGGSGMLGSDVVTDFAARGWPVSSPSRSDLDVTLARSLESLRKRAYGDFDWVVNCSGYTRVDQAESEVMAAMALNAVTPGGLAAVCSENGWRFLHVSTDFVFDGLKGSAYVESDATRPLGVYGRSKLAGESNVRDQLPESLIVRTSWLFGPNGKSFPRTILEAWLAGKALRVVGDQWGNPTSTVHLARVLGDLLSLGPPGGVYHASGLDTMSWHGFASAVLQAYVRTTGADRAVSIEAVSTAEWTTPAKRPVNSSLDCSKLWALGVPPMPPTTEALDGFVQRLVSDRLLPDTVVPTEA